MMRFLVACCVAFALTPLAAQSRADLSGSWAMDEARSGSPSGVGFKGPVVWVIQQTSDQIVLERRRGTDADRYVYTFSEGAPAPRDRAIAAPVADAPGHRAYWDGDRLILETHQNVQGKTVTARESLSLTSAGELVVERVVEVEHGYTMKDAQNSSSVKDTFVKSAG